MLLVHYSSCVYNTTEYMSRCGTYYNNTTKIIKIICISHISYIHMSMHLVKHAIIKSKLSTVSHAYHGIYIKAFNG